MKQATAYQKAISYLARREHSAHELNQKLSRAGFEQAEIEQTLTHLIESGLQSDYRFAESYIRSRANRGYGKQRIKQELKEKGLSSSSIDDGLEKNEIDWFTLAIDVRCKRFGEQSPSDFKERAKQQRFLQYRGFTHEQINESLNRQNEE